MATAECERNAKNMSQGYMVLAGSGCRQPRVRVSFCAQDQQTTCSHDSRNSNNINTNDSNNINTNDSNNINTNDSNNINTNDTWRFLAFSELTALTSRSVISSVKSGAMKNWAKMSRAPSKYACAPDDDEGAAP